MSVCTHTLSVEFVIGPDTFKAKGSAEDVMAIFREWLASADSGDPAALAAHLKAKAALIAEAVAKLEGATQTIGTTAT